MVYKSSSSSSSVQETTGYSGISSRISYYQTTLDNPSGLSSTTALTKTETYSSNTYVVSTSNEYQYNGTKLTMTESYTKGSTKTIARRTTQGTMYGTVTNKVDGIRCTGSFTITYNLYSKTLGGLYATTTYRQSYCSSYTCCSHTTELNYTATVVREITAVTYYTRINISAYAGSSSKQSDYYTSSTDQANMSNITNLTASSSESASMMTWV